MKVKMGLLPMSSNDVLEAMKELHSWYPTPDTILIHPEAYCSVAANVRS
jgi:hypothetical protein